MGSLEKEVEEELRKARQSTEIGRALGTRGVAVADATAPLWQHVIAMLDAHDALLKRLAAEVDRLRSGDLGKLK